MDPLSAVGGAGQCHAKHGDRRSGSARHRRLSLYPVPQGDVGGPLILLFGEDMPGVEEGGGQIDGAAGNPHEDACELLVVERAHAPSLCRQPVRAIDGAAGEG